MGKCVTHIYIYRRVGFVRAALLRPRGDHNPFSVLLEGCKYLEYSRRLLNVQLSVTGYIHSTHGTSFLRRKRKDDD